jgi:hypothetical protein
MNSTQHTGAAGELLVSTFFLQNGLEVFRNVASSGPVDLVLYNKHTKKTILVDVKSMRNPYVRADGQITFTSKCLLRDDGVWQIVYVHGEASPRLPEGFWEALGMETSDEYS